MPATPAEPTDKPRRFYKAVSTGPDAGGFVVLLDGRRARTPAGAPLLAPTEALAEVLAAEWAAQGEVIDTGAMPATRLAATALDRTGAARAGLADGVARFAGADLLCYFAEGPEALLEREVAHWRPVLDWAEAELGLELVRATGIVHRPQPPETVERVRALAAALPDFELTALAFAAALFGSAVLAFALQRGKLSGEAAFELSRLDESFQEERWGVDYEAAERAQRMRTEAEMLDRWFAALRS
jgi:chaperone required for assembly of F1-ATPase